MVSHAAPLRRLSLAAILLFLPVRPVAAQRPEPGDTVRVTTADRRVIVGRLRLLSQDTLIIEPFGADPLRFTRQALTRLEVRQGTRRRRLKGAAIGFVAGAAIGALIGQSADQAADREDARQCETSCFFRHRIGDGIEIAYGGAAGGLVGMGIGFGVGAWRVPDWRPVPLTSPLAIGGRDRMR